MLSSFIARLVRQPRRSPVRRCVAWLVFGVSLLGAGALGAEIYRWQDADGRLHFAQDLGQVPPAYREQAAAAARAPRERPAIQQYRAQPAAPRPSAARRKPGAASGGDATVHRIRVARAGNSMRVQVTINDAVEVPFIVDTGASHVSLPAWAAKELGLELEGARTQVYRTANGLIEKKVVTLDRVQLGSARVAGVPASVNETMSVGLLGLSFFNHFHYQIDPVAGVVTLRDNGLAASGDLRGGRSRSQWQGEFRGLQARRDWIDQAADDAGHGRARQRARLEEARDEVDRQLEVLESEADEARVPMSWRD